MSKVAELREQRDQLERLRFSGTRRHQHSDGTEVEFESDAAIARKIRDLDRQIEAAEVGMARRAGPIRVTTTKGV